jgi:hypothetical protein
MKNTHAVGPLITALRDDMANVRQVAAEALKEIGPPAIEPLTAVLQEGAMEVRQAAGRILERIKQDQQPQDLSDRIDLDGIDHINYGVAPERDFYPIQYIGQAKFPTQVYQGDSKSLSIDLEPYFWILPKDDGPFTVRDYESGKIILLQIDQDPNLEQFIEIELLGAGLTVHGEQKQRQRVTSQRLFYLWSCFFEKSGKHEINLVLKLIDSSNITTLGAIEHTVRVVKLDHMTQRQVWIIASLSGLISAISVLLGIVEMWQKLI